MGEIVTPGIFSPTAQKKNMRRKRYSAPGMVDVVQMLVDREESILDMGACGGSLLRLLRKVGYDAIGIDGTEGSRETTKGLVEQCDLTGDCSDYYRCATWGLFLNVGEHVPRELEDKLIDNVCMIPTTGLIVAWADPWTPDRRTLNRRCDYYVANRFGARNWTVDQDETEKARALVGEYSRLDKRLLILRSEREIRQGAVQ
jgi:hypothetical protein